MKLVALTDGSVTGTATIITKLHTIGGVLITADGTNDATILLKRNDANGKEIFQLVTKTPMFVVGPIHTEGTDTVYYSITGTGAAAQLYEWRD